MATAKRPSTAARKRKLGDAIEILRSLNFGPRQSNEVAAYTFLALLDLTADAPWSAASNPLRGITPIIEFIAENYGVRYAPNTRETIRDEAVKYFVEMALLLRNPDNPSRPTNSGRTAYQVEPTALALVRMFGTKTWLAQLKNYLTNRSKIRQVIERDRNLARIPVMLPSGKTVTLSPGGQNPLIKQVIEHDTKRNWLFLMEAVMSAGAVDWKRRNELKELFKGCKAGLVFVTAFETRRSMQSFHAEISWETEVWFAEAPDHLVHFDGERFLGPYLDQS